MSAFDLAEVERPNLLRENSLSLIRRLYMSVLDHLATSGDLLLDIGVEFLRTRSRCLHRSALATGYDRVPHCPRFIDRLPRQE